MKIIWTEPAVDDLESIKNYIARDSEIYALQFVQKIINCIEKVCSFPKIGREVPEANNKNIREVIFSNYRIIYRIKRESILILAIIHGARDVNRIDIKPWEII
jgi:addiction module RelE/StbE family toxin